MRNQWLIASAFLALVSPAKAATFNANYTSCLHAFESGLIPGSAVGYITASEGQKAQTLLATEKQIQLIEMTENPSAGPVAAFMVPETDTIVLHGYRRDLGIQLMWARYFPKGSTSYPELSKTTVLQPQEALKRLRQVASAEIEMQRRDDAAKKEFLPKFLRGEIIYTNRFVPQLAPPNVINEALANSMLQDLEVRRRLLKTCEELNDPALTGLAIDRREIYDNLDARIRELMQKPTLPGSALQELPKSKTN